ncbi:hypothetical protein [Streptomyces gilvus]|uniref:hypothetical protein n=1 Tax=Streptomyces gilvus TaxID=2920937 RepID=UPI001F0CEF10|nr:hypothetical protein [Streptomyces sp. CME 23]MCH5672525.1 hypothetical protein [Streptomyces sp. CME 23]
MNRHLRKAALVTAAISAGLLMTACQNGSSHSGGSTGTGSSQHTSTSRTSGTSKVSKNGSRTSKSSHVSGTSARNTSGTARGDSATVTGGTVGYLAPGKYTVHVPGRTDQAFFTATDTEVYGAGKVCGSPRSEARPRCTLAQLETATRKAPVTADVTIRNGVATVVRERHDAESGGTGGSGANATYDGTVSYLAPGKYTVAPKQGGAPQAFYVANDTVVHGAGGICGSPMAESTSTCTLDQLETAAKKGVTAKVVIADGVATSVTEDR